LPLAPSHGRMIHGPPRRSSPTVVSKQRQSPADWPDGWPRPDGASWETEGANTSVRLQPPSRIRRSPSVSQLAPSGRGPTIGPVGRLCRCFETTVGEERRGGPWIIRPCEGAKGNRHQTRASRGGASSATSGSTGEFQPAVHNKPLVVDRKVRVRRLKPPYRRHADVGVRRRGGFSRRVWRYRISFVGWAQPTVL